MTLLQAALLGFIEGLTEFLPISSTAHLILAGQVLGLPQSTFLSYFQVFIQSGAMVAVILMYWGTFRKHTELLAKILVSFLPTAIIALLLRDVVKQLFFQSNDIIAWSLILVGLAFVAVEYVIKRNHIQLSKSLNSLTYKDAFIIGLIQSCAIVPGVSRAGAVLIIMMLMRYKRSDAALFSFYLAVPTIIGAGIADSFFFYPTALSIHEITLITIGFTIAAGSSYMFMKWLINYLRQNTLHIFAYYRILLGIIILLTTLYG